MSAGRGPLVGVRLRGVLPVEPLLDLGSCIPWVPYEDPGGVVPVCTGNRDARGPMVPFTGEDAESEPREPGYECPPAIGMLLPLLCGIPLGRSLLTLRRGSVEFCCSVGG